VGQGCHMTLVKRKIASLTTLCLIEPRMEKVKVEMNLATLENEGRTQGNSRVFPFLPNCKMKGRVLTRSVLNNGG
jgi:hypothetical protein